MNRNKIIELAKKIKALAEKGKGGERSSAKEKLERLCLKYNILPSELIIIEEVKDFYFNGRIGGVRNTFGKGTSKKTDSSNWG